MSRNLHPKVAFHLPAAEMEQLKAQIPPGKNMTDLLIAIVRSHLRKTNGLDATKALALKLAVEALLGELT